MAFLLQLLYHPPEMPEIYIPLPARMVPGIQATIAQAFKLAYDRGLLDGFLLGVIVAMLVTKLSRTKGVSDVVDLF